MSLAGKMFFLILILLFVILAYQKDSISAEGAGEGKQEKTTYRFTLKQAIDRAFEYNRNFQNSRDGVRQSRLGLRLAESTFEPKLMPSLTAETGASSSAKSYNLQLTEKIITGADIGLSANTSESDSSAPYASSLTASVTQPLLKGAWPLAVTSGLVDAQRGVTAQERALERARQQLIFEVSSSYYRLANYSRQMEIHQRFLDRSERFLEGTRDRYKTDPGQNAEMDMLRAEILVSNQKQSMTFPREAMGNEEDAIKTLLAVKADESVELADGVVYQPVEINQSVSIDTALESRPDYMEAKSRIQDMERYLKIRGRDKLPNVNVYGRYKRYESDGSFGQSWGIDGKEWAVGLTASYTFPATAEDVSYEQTSISLMTQRRSLEDMKDNIAKEVKSAVRSIEESKKRAEALKGEVEQGEKRLKLAVQRYEKGLTDNFEVMYAERDLLFSKNNHSIAVTDYMIAQNRLMLAMGVLTVENLPSTAPAVPADLSRVHEKPQKDVGSLYNEAMRYFDAGKYPEARELFLTVGKEYPEDKLSEYSMYFYAICFYKEGKYKDVIKTFEGFIRDYPKSKYAAEAYYHIGISYQRLGQGPAAKEIFDKVIKGFSDSEWAVFSKDRLKEMK